MKELERLNPSKVKPLLLKLHPLFGCIPHAGIYQRMGSDDNKLDFWAVHDSFGTHASDVDKLREVESVHFTNST